MQRSSPARDREWINAAGLVLVRQLPRSTKGIMFITIEDESGIANRALAFRERAEGHFLRKLAWRGARKVQREGEVVIHLVAHQLTDLSAALRSVGDRDQPFGLPHGAATRQRPEAADQRGLSYASQTT